jgi:hypothetical protein
MKQFNKEMHSSYLGYKFRTEFTCLRTLKTISEELKLIDKIFNSKDCEDLL